MNKITMKEKISYGFGDLACNTLFTVISSYLMFFYTDIAGIGLAAVGTIMLVSRVVDAVTDPLMGNIVDRTNTKWGKARPYVLWMAVPFAISGVLMFTVPDLSSQGKFIYALITYVLFCVVYTALNIPYTTMLSNLTDDSGARLSFNMFKMIGSSAGAFIASGVTLRSWAEPTGRLDLPEQLPCMALWALCCSSSALRTQRNVLCQSRRRSH